MREENEEVWVIDRQEWRGNTGREEPLNVDSSFSEKRLSYNSLRLPQFHHGT